MTAQKKMITEKEIRIHIGKNIERWLFAGHVADRHINATAKELQARLGKYSNESKLISRASSFLDMTGGDDIVNGLAADLQNQSGEILKWVLYGKKEIAILRFKGFPAGVRGITCSISEHDFFEADGYIAILCKNEQEPFYLLNAYPTIRKA